MDKKTVERVADLANIELTDEQVSQLEPQLSDIMGFVEQLAEADTADVKPLANVVNIDLRLREDAVTDGGYPDKVLANAPEETLNYFVVPKIVETEE